MLESAIKQNFGQVDAIETNGFWAENEKIIKQNLETLGQLGMNRLKISCDPFHQEFVDIEYVKRLADEAIRILGKERVLVRWQKYLDNPTNVKNLSADEKNALLISSLKEYPCRFTGRAAGGLAKLAANEPIDKIKNKNCKQSFLDSKGIHIDPYGNVFSGTCSGIVLGNIAKKPLEKIWQDFHPSNDKIIETLFNLGPAGLLNEAETLGYKRLNLYAGKCHLCSNIRQFFFHKGLYKESIAPADCYS